MEQLILQDETPKERLATLKNNADKAEIFTYPLALSPVEITNLKDEFSNLAIKESKLMEAKKKFMESHKSELKPLKLEMVQKMQKIRSKVNEVTEEVYLIADMKSNQMCYYNGGGLLVYNRPLLPNEKQLSIVPGLEITGTES